MKFFLLLDYILGWQVVIPADPWNSYRYKREETKIVCPVCSTTAKDIKSSAQYDFNSFIHITPDISCEAKRARAVKLGCVERGEIHTAADAKRERASKVSDMSADFDSFDAVF